MTAYTDDDVTRYLAASDDNWRRETGGMEPPPNGPEDYADAEHVLAAVAPQIAERAKREAMPEAAEWLREWFATGPDPAQGVRLIQEFVAWAQVNP